MTVSDSPPSLAWLRRDLRLRDNTALAEAGREGPVVVLFVFDTTIVAWLLWGKSRVIAYVILCGFHAATGYFFNLGMFPLIMSGAALVFFPPELPRRVIRALARRVLRRDAHRAAVGITEQGLDAADGHHHGAGGVAGVGAE